MSESRQATERQVEVFIVGGGPIGLAMALTMDRFGIGYALVERASSTTDHPKARGCWQRTMEIFRQWGVEAAVRARALPDHTDVFAFVQSMAGLEYGRTRPEINMGQTPSWKSVVSQDVVEESLLDVVRRTRQGHVRFDTEFESYEEDEDEVRVTIRPLEGGPREIWRARYLIAADGAGSSIRKMAGLEMTGPATLAVMANDYWEADLSHLPSVRQVGGWRIAPTCQDIPVSTVLNTNGKDRWLTLSQVGRETDERSPPWSEARVIEIARAHAGIPDLPVRLINRSVWRLSRQVANRFSRGRVHLVGDAAHRFPPFGGFGMNSGIQDVHNLAWKLAMVLRCQANPTLLDSYDVERRPIAESNANFALSNTHRFAKVEEAFASGNRDEIDFWIKDSENHLHSIGQGLGYSYDEGAVIADGTAKPAMRTRYYDPSDRPGARFPHVWLDMARTRSTLDWFDQDFVLVAGPFADAWKEAARAVSRRMNLPIAVRQLETVHEADGFGMGVRGAVLVRPDGHVAWRMPWTPVDAQKTLGQALSTLVGWTD